MFTGHLIPIWGSLQSTIPSPLGFQVVVHLYCSSATSEVTQNPRANPGGAQTWNLFSADTSTPCHCPNVGEPMRISTATRNTEPKVTRISLPRGLSYWKCRPRTTPRIDREWLSCGN